MPITGYSAVTVAVGSKQDAGACTYVIPANPQRPKIMSKPQPNRPLIFNII